jgi:hypothetical protein
VFEPQSSGSISVQGYPSTLLRPLLTVATAGIFAISLTGCGLEAAPKPPSLMLPEPVADLTAARAGDQVHLHWTMPHRTTDKLPLAGGQRVRICRRVENGPCQVAANLVLAPRAEGDFTDPLPAALTTDPAHLLVYTVELLNRAGQDAGPSNAAYTATGLAPLPILDLSAAADARGVLLRWKPAPGSRDDIRIHRVLVEVAHPSGEQGQQTAGPPPLPATQTLEVTEADGRALDPDAALDHIYTFTVARVQKLSLDNQPVEVSGVSSPPVTIDARDVFPPQTPMGLQAVADPDARAIDLSWIPDNDLDIAGYVVYRRDAGSSAAPVRISSPGQVAPSIRDSAVESGRRYEFSVSAVDRDGNESPRSAEVEEGLPQP